MFGNFEAAKHRKAPPWAGPLLMGVVVFHIGLFLFMWVKTIWDLEQLERPKTSIDLAVAPPPPPPPPPPPGGAKPHDVQIQPKKIKVRDIVQPVKIEKQEVEAGPKTTAIRTARSAAKKVALPVVWSVAWSVHRRRRRRRRRHRRRRRSSRRRCSKARASRARR